VYNELDVLVRWRVTESDVNVLTPAGLDYVSRTMARESRSRITHAGRPSSGSELIHDWERTTLRRLVPQKADAQEMLPIFKCRDHSKNNLGQQKTYHLSPVSRFPMWMEPGNVVSGFFLGFRLKGARLILREPRRRRRQARNTS
jgi:hypothetical protein